MDTRERMQRAADRLAASGAARAIDLLAASVCKVLNEPHNERFRTVNPSHPAMQPVADARGGVEFLWSVGYEPIHGHLVLQHHDPQRLQQGLAELERVRRGGEYMAAKAKLQAEATSAAARKARKEREASTRRKFLAKVPAEPAAGEAGSSLLCLHVGKGERVWRRFESCNTVEDVLNYVRSLPAVDPDAPVVLKNVTTAPAVSLSAPELQGFTLQRLDLWPSGHVEVCCAA